MVEIFGTKLLVSPDSVNLQQIPSFLGTVHARYTYQSWLLSPEGTWLDASGNGFDGNVSRGSVSGYLTSGNGATKP
eukprot:322347-Rhodomonas_salina.1